MIRTLSLRPGSLFAHCQECGTTTLLASASSCEMPLKELREVQSAHALCVPQSVRLDEMKESR